MSLPYHWFAFLVYSLLPISFTTVLTVKLTIRLIIDASKDALVPREDVNRRVMGKILLILSMFIVCTLPSRFVSIIMDMVSFKSRSVLLGFQFLSYILYSLQGSLNPILYSMLAKAWRRKVSEVIHSMVEGNTVSMKRFSRSITANSEVMHGVQVCP